MYGRSRTSSFGLTMKPLTAGDQTGEQMRGRGGRHGARRPGEQRRVTLADAAASAPRTSSTATIVMAVNLT